MIAVRTKTKRIPKIILTSLVLLVCFLGCTQKRLDGPDVYTFEEKDATVNAVCQTIDKDLDALHDELKAIERVFGKPLDQNIYHSLNEAKQAVKRRDYEASEKFYKQTIDLAKDHLVDGSAVQEYRIALENIGRRLENKGQCKEAWNELLAFRANEILRKIIIPELKFDPPATLIDAVDFFTQASRDYDDPKVPVQQRGISLCLKLRHNVPEECGSKDPFAAATSDRQNNDSVPVLPHISARFISLYDALRLVCDVTGYKFDTRGGLIMITPVDDDKEPTGAKR